MGSVYSGPVAVLLHVSLTVRGPQYFVHRGHSLRM